MYFLNVCNSSGVLRTLYIVKLALQITMTVLPIIVIVLFMVNAFKAVVDGKSDSLKEVFQLNVKRLIAALIVFLIPGMLDFVFSSLVTMDVEFATCWTNANLDGINQAAIDEEKTLEEERQATKEALAEAAKERAALEAARNEIIKQQREEYNNGGRLHSDILRNGTEGEYFAPLQGRKGGSGSSVTGGCSNKSPVYHDIGASVGTPVYAPYDGTAKYIQSNCNGVLYSFGNQVRVFKDDGSGTYVVYAHFSKFPDGISMPITADCVKSTKKCGAGHCTSGMTSTKVAEVTVKKGQLIGWTGNTGNSAGPHLHVEIHKNGSSACVTDPWAVFGMR